MQFMRIKGWNIGFFVVCLKLYVANTNTFKTRNQEKLFLICMCVCIDVLHSFFLF